MSANFRPFLCIAFLIPCARHYNPRFVYFLPTFWKSKSFFQGGFFRKFCPYVWLVLKRGFWLRAGYNGACTVFKNFWQEKKMQKKEQRKEETILKVIPFHRLSLILWRFRWLRINSIIIYFSEWKGGSPIDNMDLASFPVHSVIKMNSSLVNERVKWLLIWKMYFAEEIFSFT